jgi:hypothetical protein
LGEGFTHPAELDFRVILQEKDRRQTMTINKVRIQTLKSLLISTYTGGKFPSFGRRD